MTRDHHSRRPQIRPIRPERVTESSEMLVPTTYEGLLAQFEVEGDTFTEKPGSMLGLSYLKTLTGFAPDGAVSEEDLRLAAVVTTKSLFLGVEHLQNEGFDILADRNALSGAGITAKTSFAAQSARNMLRVYRDDNNGIEALTYTSAANLFDVFVTSDRMLRHASETLQLEATGMSGEPSMILTWTLARARLYRNAANNPSAFRNDTHRQLVRLLHPAMREFVDRELDAYDKRIEQWPYESVGTEDVMHENLDFRILPPGHTLQTYVQKMLETLTPGDKARVDIRRVAVLEELRTKMEVPGSYFVHGKPRGTVHDQEYGDINEAYIGLVMPYYDASNHLIGEDVLVVSPVARRHAGYVVRYNVSQRNWREVLSADKTKARALGARQLKFTTVGGEDMYGVFVRKAIELLTCPPKQFGPQHELRRRRDGSYFLAPRVFRSVGEIALAVAGHQTLITPDNDM